MTAAIFLPGILMPGHLRYRGLLDALGSPQGALVKELEISSGDRPPDGDVITAEIEGLDRFATTHRLDRFHLYGYSIGATVALAYVAAHGDEKVLSLALDEPATDFSDEDRQQIADQTPDFDQLPEDERILAFVQSVVRPGVPLPPQPPAPRESMAKASSAIAAASRALRDYRVDESRLRAFRGPVYVSYGSLSSARWETMAERLVKTFADCIVERYEGLHHLHTGHQAEPERVAAALQQLWQRASPTDLTLPPST